MQCIVYYCTDDHARFVRLHPSVLDISHYLNVLHPPGVILLEMLLVLHVHEETPWEALKYLTGEVLCGGVIRHAIYPILLHSLQCNICYITPISHYLLYLTNQLSIQLLKMLLLLHVNEALKYLTGEMVYLDVAPHAIYIFIIALMTMHYSLYCTH